MAAPLRPHMIFAEKALASAELLLAVDDLNAAVNRSYYACHDAARGVLAALGETDSGEIKTHSGLIRLFSLKVIKSGLMPSDLASVLGQENDIRQLADYGSGVTLLSEARFALERARAFVAACRLVIGSLKNATPTS
jgi:uncharacterized protein (UPF0332 family)